MLEGHMDAGAFGISDEEACLRIRCAPGRARVVVGRRACAA